MGPGTEEKPAGGGGEYGESNIEPGGNLRARGNLKRSVSYLNINLAGSAGRW